MGSRAFSLAKLLHRYKALSCSLSFSHIDSEMLSAQEAFTATHPRSNPPSLILAVFLTLDTEFVAVLYGKNGKRESKLALSVTTARQAISISRSHCKKLAPSFATAIGKYHRRIIYRCIIERKRERDGERCGVRQWRL